ncbi:hypothetical protein OGAPHI_001192 [Ogataea philodendri]|uniref:Uncharacterized protein n=1 Tax=Ogataea philodendri TaxID=1378263 RepID=A0A9P8PG66_9ASCO|nr:uncharacterized protein OGAPHI_001192 [Ogataea philodendri]KAH3670677.1 hypothetical protein OGAPHI_001192 [Ogataea philodendri]
MAGEKLYGSPPNTSASVAFNTEYQNNEAPSLQDSTEDLGGNPLAVTLDIGKPEIETQRTKRRHQINGSFSVLLGQRHQQQVSQTKKQKEVTSTVVQVRKTNSTVVGDFRENGINTTRRNTTAKHENHQTEGVHQLAAFAPVKRVVGVVGRLGNQHDSRLGFSHMGRLVQINKVRSSGNSRVVNFTHGVAGWSNW